MNNDSSFVITMFGISFSIVKSSDTNHAIFYALCPFMQILFVQESSLQEAVRQVEELKAKVNKILSKHSPVLLIQKTFRMFAIRKRYKYLMATRVW